MLHIATRAALLEVFVGLVGESQGIIKLPACQEPSIGGDGGAVELQADFGVELEPERGFIAVTHKVPPGWLRYLKETPMYMGVL